MVLTDEAAGCDLLGAAPASVNPSVWIRNPASLVSPRTVELHDATGALVADTATVEWLTDFELADAGGASTGTAAGRFTATFGTQTLSGTFQAAGCRHVAP